MKRGISLILSLVILISTFSFGLTKVSAESQVDAFVRIAIEQTGNGYQSKYGPAGAWCAGFVSWCATQAGINGSIIPVSNYCADIFNQLKNKGAQEVYSPIKGDLIFYDDDYDTSYFNHIGIMINGTETVQGNLNNKVQKLNESYVIAGNVKRYLRPVYTAISKPTNAIISIAKNVYEPNENVTFNSSANDAAGYCIGIDKGNTRIYTGDCGTSYTRSFSEIGDYSAYVTAWNSSGGMDSNRVYFTITNKPGVPNLTVTKATYNSTEDVTFLWGATSDTTNYDLRILQNGSVIKTIYSLGDTNYSIQLPPDDYSAYLCSVNTTYTEWWTKGNTVDFTVVSAPVIDLASVAWASEQIQSLVSRGVINGKSITSDGIVFAPEDQITRAELTKLIVNAFSIQGSGTDANFNDVTADAWYYNLVGAAYKSGIINGTSTETFDPESPITRQDIATIIIRTMVNYQSKQLITLGLVNEKLSIFNDAGVISDYAKVYVSTAVYLGIIQGTNDDGSLKFKPLDNTNRAEAAVVIYRVLQPSTPPTPTPTPTVPKADIPDGVYNIVNKASGRFMNAFSDAATNNPWMVVTDTPDGSQEQKFNIVKQADGSYLLICMNSTYGGSAKLTDCSSTFNIGAQFNVCNTSYPSSQSFYIFDRGNGLYSISLSYANNPDISIGQSGILAYNKPLLQLSNYTGANEQWEFKK